MGGGGITITASSYGTMLWIGAIYTGYELFSVQ